MPPFFSIVIPAYNRAAMIETALDSVLRQAVTDFEVIVVDDGSTDNTVAVATAFAARFSQTVKIITQPNGGPGAARNTGIQNATGQYVAFLDSDDVWFPWTLALFQKAITDYSQPAFVCGIPIDVRPGEPINADGNKTMRVERHADFYSAPGNPFYRFTTSGVAIQRSSLERVKGFAVEGFEDLDLWMRMGVETGFLIICEPPIVVRRLFGNNLSNSRRYNRSGTQAMIASEKSGRYPGGPQRQADRRRLLSVLMRAASVQMARQREIAAALFVYRQIWGWSLNERRFKYLAGLPLQIVIRTLGFKS